MDIWKEWELESSFMLIITYFFVSRGNDVKKNWQSWSSVTSESERHLMTLCIHYA